MGYARSPFRVSENNLRKVAGLDEDDIQLILKQYDSNIITYESPPVITQLMIFQRSFKPWVIMKGPYNLNMMTLA